MLRGIRKEGHVTSDTKYPLLTVAVTGSGILRVVDGDDESNVIYVLLD